MAACGRPASDNGTKAGAQGIQHTSPGCRTQQQKPAFISGGACPATEVRSHTRVRLRTRPPAGWMCGCLWPQYKTQRPGSNRHIPTATQGPASLQKCLAAPPSQPQPALICSLPFKWCRRRDRPLPVQALCLRSSLYNSDIPVKKQQSTPGGSKSHSGRLLAAPGGTHALGRAPVSAGSAGATVPVGHQLVDAR